MSKTKVDFCTVKLEKQILAGWFVLKLQEYEQKPINITLWFEALSDYTHDDFQELIGEYKHTIVHVMGFHYPVKKIRPSINKSYLSQFVFDISDHVDIYGGYWINVDYLVDSSLSIGSKMVAMIELLSQ